MPLAVLLTLLLVFAGLRRLLEPACPHCSAKRWSESQQALTCTDCGWSNVTPAAEPAAQFELIA